MGKSASKKVKGGKATMKHKKMSGGALSYTDRFNLGTSLSLYNETKNEAIMALIDKIDTFYSFNTYFKSDKLKNKETGKLKYSVTLLNALTAKLKQLKGAKGISQEDYNGIEAFLDEISKVIKNTDTNQSKEPVVNRSKYSDEIRGINTEEINEETLPPTYEKGNTLLHKIILDGSKEDLIKLIETSSLLIENSLNVENNDGITPVMLSVIQKKEQGVMWNLLLQKFSEDIEYAQPTSKAIYLDLPVDKNVMPQETGRVDLPVDPNAMPQETGLDLPVDPNAIPQETGLNSPVNPNLTPKNPEEFMLPVNSTILHAVCLLSNEKVLFDNVPRLGPVTQLGTAGTPQEPFINPVFLPLINLQDGNNNTPLIYVAKSEIVNPIIIKALLSMGAKYSLTNKEGKSALNILEEKRQKILDSTGKTTPKAIALKNNKIKPISEAIEFINLAIKKDSWMSKIPSLSSSATAPATGAATAPANTNRTWLGFVTGAPATGTPAAATGTPVAGGSKKRKNKKTANKKKTTSRKHK